jgi:hypothetical protein
LVPRLILTSDQELLVETTSFTPFLVKLLTTLFVYTSLDLIILTHVSINQSQTSISELNTAVNNAKDKQKQGAGSNQLKSLLSKLQGGGDGSMASDVDQMTAPPAKNPETMDPSELYANIWRILTIRDCCKFPWQQSVIAVTHTLAVVKKIEKVIEKIPGLGNLIEELMNSIAVLVFTSLEVSHNFSL